MTSKTADIQSLAPEFSKLTDELLYGDIWHRTDISQRDRSLVTISVLAALNRIEQLDFHLNYGLENGLTEQEIVAALTQVAFYAGWPAAVSGIRHFNEVLSQRNTKR